MRSNQINGCETSHILHLLLTVITGGLWGVVWILVALSNSMKRKATMKQSKYADVCVRCGCPR